MLCAKTCSVCKKKVKQSELKEIETIGGRNIIYCENCAKRFIVKQNKIMEFIKDYAMQDGWSKEQIKL